MTVSNVNVSAATLGTYIYTATGGETLKSGADDNGATLSYIPGKELVHVNGVLLVKTSDYTATDGSSITLVNALVAGDVLEVVSFSPFNVANAVPSTTVTAKGDLLVASGTGAVTNLPVGADGTTLVANSSAATGMSWATPVASLANPVINGGFDIWQRNTTVSYAASTASYSSDRWYFGVNANGASTIARYATNDTTNLPNIQYCARVQRNSGQTGTGYYGFDSSIETANSVPYAGKTVTFSFYARAGALYSTASNNLYFQLVSGTGTDQSVTSGFTGATYPINTQAVLTTNWQRFTATGTIPTNSSQLGIRFLTNPTGTAGASDYFEITGVQIDLGTYNAATAPAFRRSGGTLQGELAACQRYYCRFSAQSVYDWLGEYAYSASSTIAYSVHQFPVTMRAYPTVIDYNQVAFWDYQAGSYAASGPGIQTNGINGTLVAWTISGGTAGRNGYLRANNNASAYLGFGAEL